MYDRRKLEAKRARKKQLEHIYSHRRFVKTLLCAARRGRNCIKEDFTYCVWYVSDGRDFGGKFAILCMAFRWLNSSLKIEWILWYSPLMNHISFNHFFFSVTCHQISFPISQSEIQMNCDRKTCSEYFPKKYSSIWLCYSQNSIVWQKYWMVDCVWFFVINYLYYSYDETYSIGWIRWIVRMVCLSFFGHPSTKCRSHHRYHSFLWIFSARLFRYLPIFARKLESIWNRSQTKVVNRHRNWA